MTIGPAAYVGPVFTCYEHVEEGELKRLTDEEWSTVLHQADPKPPAWTEAFRVAP